MEVHELKSKCQGAHQGPSVIFRLCPHFDEWLELGSTRTSLPRPPTPSVTGHSLAGAERQEDGGRVWGWDNYPAKPQMIWGGVAPPGCGSGNARSGNVGCDPLGLRRELAVGQWMSGVSRLTVPRGRSRSVSVGSQRAAH